MRRRPRRLAWARFFAALAVTVSGAVAVTNARTAAAIEHPSHALGPAPGLCKMDTSRGSVPSDFAIAACVNTTGVWLRNTIQVPIQIQATGDVRTPVRVTSDLGFAATVTRLKYKSPYLLVPSDIMRIPVGAGPATVTLASTGAGGLFALATTAASFFPGGVPKAIYDSLTKLVSELADVYAKRADCMVGKNLAGRTYCETIWVRDVGFAIARAGITAFGSAAARLFTSVISWGKFINAQPAAISTLLKTHRSIKLSGIGPNPPTDCTGSIVVDVTYNFLSQQNAGDGFVGLLARFDGSSLPWALADGLTHLQFRQDTATTVCEAWSSNGTFATIHGTSPNGTGHLPDGLTGKFSASGITEWSGVPDPSKTRFSATGYLGTFGPGCQVISSATGEVLSCGPGTPGVLNWFSEDLSTPYQMSAQLQYGSASFTAAVETSQGSRGGSRGTRHRNATRSHPTERDRSTGRSA